MKYWERYISSTETEVISFCSRFHPRKNHKFVRPSGKIIAVWVRSDSGDAELFCLSKNKKGLVVLLKREGNYYSESRIDEKDVMRSWGMNP